MEPDAELAQVVIKDLTSTNWLLFTQPVDVLSTTKLSKVLQTIQQAEKLAQAGHYVVGFINANTAPAWNSYFEALVSLEYPLVWFGIFNQPTKITPSKKNHINPFLKNSWRSEIDFKHYQQKITQIKSEILKGNCYQINFTYRLFSTLKHEFNFNAAKEFLVNTNSGQGAIFDTADFVVYSNSPELLFFKTGDYIVTKPMKGTISRGLYLEDDLAKKHKLEHSLKDQAENIMIADMLRNDIGKIATSGTMQAKNICKVDKYGDLWQMTTEVSARTNSDLTSILAALFPPASVTGAPKINALRLIKQLELSPRNVYCGSIGLLHKNLMRFNVAIRTLSLNKKNKKLEYGTGGGITYNSNARSEYKESKIKASILNIKLPFKNFELIESILFFNDLKNLTLHLTRLEKSAIYFGFKYNQAELLNKLISATARLLIETKYKIRLLLHPDGSAIITTQKINEENFKQLQLATNPIDHKNCLFYHKTTARHIYEQPNQSLNHDILFFNKYDEITETSIANIGLEIEGKIYTPEIKSGLLAGVKRQELINSKRIIPAKLKLADLKTARKIYLFNSIKGIKTTKLIL